MVKTMVIWNETKQSNTTDKLWSLFFFVFALLEDGVS